jgi:hypothetical protein
MGEPNSRKETRAIAGRSWKDWIAWGRRGETRTDGLGDTHRVDDVSDTHVDYTTTRPDGSTSTGRMVRNTDPLARMNNSDE